MICNDIKGLRNWNALQKTWQKLADQPLTESKEIVIIFFENLYLCWIVIQLCLQSKPRNCPLFLPFKMLQEITFATIKVRKCPLDLCIVWRVSFRHIRETLNLSPWGTPMFIDLRRGPWTLKGTRKTVQNHKGF